MKNFTILILILFYSCGPTLADIENSNNSDNSNSDQIYNLEKEDIDQKTNDTFDESIQIDQDLTIENIKEKIPKLNNGFKQLFSGITNIDDIQNTVYIAGYVGAGKSTFINYCQGCRFKVVNIDGEELLFKGKENKNDKNPKIGSGFISVTGFPQTYWIQNQVNKQRYCLADLPGQLDKIYDPIKKIVTVCGVNYLIQIFKGRAKIILMIEEDSLLEDKGSLFFDVIKDIIPKLFKNYKTKNYTKVNDPLRSIYFIFNKTSVFENSKQIIEYVQWLTDELVKENDEYDQEKIYWLKKILQFKNIEIFNPLDKGESKEKIFKLIGNDDKDGLENKEFKFLGSSATLDFFKNYTNIITKKSKILLDSILISIPKQIEILLTKYREFSDNKNQNQKNIKTLEQLYQQKSKEYLEILNKQKQLFANIYNEKLSNIQKNKADEYKLLQSEKNQKLKLAQLAFLEKKELIPREAKQLANTEIKINTIKNLRRFYYDLAAEAEHISYIQKSKYAFSKEMNRKILKLKMERNELLRLPNHSINSIQNRLKIDSAASGELQKILDDLMTKKRTVEQKYNYEISMLESQKYYEAKTYEDTMYPKTREIYTNKYNNRKNKFISDLIYTKYQDNNDFMNFFNFKDKMRNLFDELLSYHVLVQKINYFYGGGYYDNLYYDIPKDKNLDTKAKELKKKIDDEIEQYQEYICSLKIFPLCYDNWDFKFRRKYPLKAKNILEKKKIFLERYFEEDLKKYKNKIIKARKINELTQQNNLKYQDDIKKIDLDYTEKNSKLDQKYQNQILKNNNKKLEELEKLNFRTEEELSILLTERDKKIEVYQKKRIQNLKKLLEISDEIIKNNRVINTMSEELNEYQIFNKYLNKIQICLRENIDLESYLSIFDYWNNNSKTILKKTKDQINLLRKNLKGYNSNLEKLSRFISE